MTRIAPNKSVRTAPDRAPSGLIRAGICIGLVLLTWMVFGQTLIHEFINYDDPDYVTKNAQVSRGLSLEGIGWAFTHVHAANWHPLTWISHMLDCQLYGLNASGHHLTNLLLHAATAVLLFLLLRRMTGSVWRSAFVAALFAIHPLRVESVAWVAERKDVLSGLFFMLTLAAYLHYGRGAQTLRKYGLLALVFSLGLMAKPMLVSVPLVLLLLDYWPLERLPALIPRTPPEWKRFRGLLFEKLPLLGLGLASCAVTIVAQQGAMQPITRMPFPERMANAALAYVEYAGQMFWPRDLAVFYPWYAGRLQSGYVTLAIALLAGISVAVVLLRNRRYLVTGWFWYVIMLGPVIGIVQVGIQARADRYTYLPQIGLYLLTAWGVAEVVGRWRFVRVPVGALAVAVVAALTLAARTQAAFWRDSETLWSHALSCTRDNVIAEANLGQAFHDKGKDSEAMVHFERSLHINRRQPSLLSSLGVFYLEMGRPRESLSYLNEALEIEPRCEDALYNLGNTYLQLGNASDALANYERALKIDPDDIQALNNLAWILATWPEASIRNGLKAVASAEHADSLTRGKNQVISATLAAAYAEAGRFPEAIQTAERAVKIALAENNAARAESIRQQLESYRSGGAVRDNRSR